MDSLTQIVLGASVGEATLGRKIGTRAMLWGAIAGTIPDLDVFVRWFTDPITATELHRGISHSLFFCIIMSPILGWIVHKIHRNRGASVKGWIILFFLCLVTHPLLDAHTNWGTQFFWPFDLRIAYKNISVIDPLYTLPFLIFTIIALTYKKENPKRRRFNNIGLIVSSVYMILTLVFKSIGYSKFSEGLEKQQIAYVEMDTKPTFFNAILWNAQVETKSGYIMAYYSFFDSQNNITFSHEYAKNHELLKPYSNQKEIKQLIKISQGWYMCEQEDDKIIFTDIRFGQFGTDQDNDAFIWRYLLTPTTNNYVSIQRLQPNIDSASAVFSNLTERIKGN